MTEAFNLNFTSPPLELVVCFTNYVIVPRSERHDVLYISPAATVVRVCRASTHSNLAARYVRDEFSKANLTYCIESQLSTHDLAIPFGAVVDPKSGNAISMRHLRVLLLSPSAVTEDKLDETTKRIQHFAALTGGYDLAIVFLLQPAPGTSFVSAESLLATSVVEDGNIDAIYSYSKLQVEIFGHTEIRSIPILPISKVEGLSQLLKKHVRTAPIGAQSESLLKRSHRWQSVRELRQSRVYQQHHSSSCGFVQRILPCRSRQCTSYQTSSLTWGSLLQLALASPLHQTRARLP